MAARLTPVIDMDCIRKKYAVIYVRVSTDEQADKGYSLESQIEACRKYAHQYGYTVVAECVEDYTGTVPIEQRPEGKWAYAMLSKGEADALIVYTIDRLVRPPEEGDEWDMPILIRGLAKLGKEIHTVSRGPLRTDFASLLIAMLDAKSAGDERRKIIERTTRGREVKAKNGKVVGIGKAPYGYRYLKENSFSISMLEIYEPEARIVCLIFTWYTEGENGCHISLDRIAARLTEMGIPTPMESAGHKRQRVLPPHMWTNATVYWIIKNETYAGVWRYRKFIGSGGNGGKRALHDTIPIAVPAIIERSVWELAQKRGVENRHSPRHAQRFYLLTGLIYCGCRERMHGANDRYVCASWSARNRLTPRTCHEPSLKADGLEAFVWDYFVGILTDPQKLTELLRAARDSLASAKQPKLDEVQIVDDMIAEVQAEATDIARALVETKGKTIVTNVLQSKATELDDRHNQLVGRREALVREMEQGQITDSDIASMVEFSRDVNLGLTRPTPELKRHWLELLQSRVTIEGGQIVIACVLGKGSGDPKNFEQFKAQTTLRAE